MWLQQEVLKVLQPDFAFQNIPLTIPSMVQSHGAIMLLQEAAHLFREEGLQDQASNLIITPGVNINSCAPGGGYSRRSGTSMAAPFVTGSAALLMEWGIIQGNDPYMYGEKLKAYLIDGARPLRIETVYPNRTLGYGALCLENTFRNMSL